MKRFLRRTLIWSARLLAIFILLIVLFYAEEDWRGARAWAACQRDLAAKGESLDLRQLAPPGKPEDDLSKVPIFAEMYERPRQHFIGLIPQDDLKPVRFDKINADLGCKDYAKIPKSTNFRKGETQNLAARQLFYRSLPQAHLTNPNATPAQDVLEALNQFDPEMNEVKVALGNPNAYWPLNYDRPFDMTLGGITSMIRVAQVLPLSATAHLENNETDLAEKDYLFSFQIERFLAAKCYLINYLVMNGVRAIDDSILWEGLHRHAWNDAQLREMESALASIDLLATGAQSLRMERACALQTMTMMQSQDSKLYQNLKEDGLTAAWYFLLLRPKGWFDQDRCHYCMVAQNAIDTIRPAQGTLTKVNNDQPPASTALQTYIPITQTTRSIYDNLAAC